MRSTWPGLERPHLLEDRARRKRVAEAEEIVDAVAVEFERVVRKRTQRLDLGRERQPALLLGNEQAA